MNQSQSPSRFSTGHPLLDRALGGGLFPGKLTVVLGATGIGKTQLGINFLHAGHAQEGERGILFDMTSRGDSQNHADYASRMHGWDLTTADAQTNPTVDEIWNPTQARKDALHLFSKSGKRVTIDDLEQEQWKAWKAELNRKITRAIGFFYANFVHGVRRVIVDGIEPTDKPSDSFQFHVFEYLYHQIFQKDDDWVARDLFRADFREQQPQVLAHRYDYQQIASTILCTSKEVMLDDLISRPIEAGDLLSNANTILLMGKIRDGLKTRRGLYIAKHRGSACDESIMLYDINETGLVFDQP